MFSRSSKSRGDPNEKNFDIGQNLTKDCLISIDGYHGLSGNPIPTESPKGMILRLPKTLEGRVCLYKELYPVQSNSEPSQLVTNVQNFDDDKRVPNEIIRYPVGMGELSISKNNYGHSLLTEGAISRFNIEPYEEGSEAPKIKTTVTIKCHRNFMSFISIKWTVVIPNPANSNKPRTLNYAYNLHQANIYENKYSGLTLEHAADIEPFYIQGVKVETPVSEEKVNDFRTQLTHKKCDKSSSNYMQDKSACGKLNTSGLVTIRRVTEELRQFIFYRFNHVSSEHINKIMEFAQQDPYYILRIPIDPSNGKLFCEGILNPFKYDNEIDFIAENWIKPAIRREGCIYVLTHDQFGRLEQFVKQFNNCLESERRKSPLNKFYKNCPEPNQHYQLDSTIHKLEDIPPVDLEPALYSFPDWRTYETAIIYGYLGELDHDMKKKQLSKCEVTPIMYTQGGGNNQLLACMTMRNKHLRENYRPRPGTRLLMIIHSSVDREDYETDVEVIPRLTGTDPEDICLIVNFRLDRDGNRIAPETGSILTAAQCTTAEIQAKAICSTKPWDCSVRETISDMNFMNVVNGIYELSSGKDFRDRYDGIQKFLLNNDINSVKEQNFIKLFRDECSVKVSIESLKEDLDEQQRYVIELAKSAPAGVVLTNGPPGTGKTYVHAKVISLLLTHKLKPRDAGFLLNEKGLKGSVQASATHPQALVVSATNDTVDKLVLSYHQLLKDEFAKRGVKIDPVVVRGHSWATEIGIFTQKPDDRQHGIDMSNQQVHKEDMKELLDSFQAVLNMHIATGRQKSLPYKDDSRVKLIEYSLGHWLMKYAGLIPGSSNERKPLKGFENLASHIRNYAVSRDYNDDDKLFTEFKRAIRLFCANHAHVLITTSSNALALNARETFSPHILIVDEASREMEGTMASLMANYPNSFVFLSGDERQLGTFTNREKYGFKENLKISMFARKIWSYYPHASLKIQYRMQPSICNLVNASLYDNTLVTAASVIDSDESKEALIAVETVLKLKLDRRYYVIQTMRSIATVNRTSVYNTRNIRVAINLLKEINPLYKDVTIITPYGAEKELIELIVTRMQKTGDLSFPPHHIIVSTIDGFQGQESGITILLIPSDYKIGHLKDFRRVNVFFTRAKHFQFLIHSSKLCSAIGFVPSIYEEPSALGKIVRSMHRSGRVQEYQKEDIDGLPYLPELDSAKK